MPSQIAAQQRGSIEASLIGDNACLQCRSQNGSTCLAAGSGNMPALACVSASLRAYSPMDLPAAGWPPPFISPAESMRTDCRPCGAGRAHVQATCKRLSVKVVTMWQGVAQRP